MSLLTNRHLLTLVLAHFVADTYTNMLPILWPVFVAAFGLNYAMVGLASMLYTVAGSLTQPVFGFLGDKFGSRWLGSLGVGLVALSMGAAALAWDYNSLVFFIFLAGIGSAAYHPQGAMNTSLLAGRRKALGMGIFMVGGNAGYALGPIVAALALSTFLGLKAVALLAIPGVIIAWFLFGLIGAVDRNRATAPTKEVFTTGVAARRAPLAAIFLVIGIIMLRGWAEIGLITYLPLLYEGRGLDRATASQALFVMLVMEALAGLLGGSLADRLDRRKVLVAAFLLAGPGLLLFLYVPAVPPLAALALVGGGIGATLPVTVVMGQELLPRNVGVASGLALGLGFVAAGIGVAITGLIADGVGLNPAMGLLAALPFLAAGLSTLLPRQRMEAARTPTAG